LADNPSVLVQRPLRWERDRAWLLGSVLGGQAKEGTVPAAFLFPVVPDQFAKSAFKLCIEHPEGMQAK